MKIVDQYGEPMQLNADDLTEEMTGPSLTGVRSIMPTWTTRAVTPDQMAAVLREAETPGHGSSRNYLELAERIEENYIHYNGVLATRKRAVTGIGIRVEPADDSAEARADADLVESVVKQGTLSAVLFDILDAIGKGFSATEIIWDTSAGQWMPERYEYRLPQWFDYDWTDGKTLLVRTDQADQTTTPQQGAAGWSRLTPYKMIIHQVQSKSGLPIRGGLARIAAWAFMFHAFSLKDWVRFIEAYGLPLRIGKYSPGASKQDKQVLWKAVRNIAGDAAAIIPESMEIEFVSDTGLTARSGIFLDLLKYLDSQVSIATVGQTLTSESGDSGSYALGNVHNLVREDIEDEDGRALAATLFRDLVIPLVTLNHGPRKKYPGIVIKRERAAEIGVFADGLSKLIPLGLRVKQDEILNRFGLTEPGPSDKILEVTPNETQDRVTRLAMLASLREQGTPDDDPLMVALNAIDAEDWQVLTGPLVQPLLDKARTDPETLIGSLADLYPELDTGALEEQLTRVLFVADTLGNLRAG